MLECSQRDNNGKHHAWPMLAQALELLHCSASVPLKHGIVAGCGHFFGTIAKQDLAFTQGLSSSVKAWINLGGIHVSQR